MKSAHATPVILTVFLIAGICHADLYGAFTYSVSDGEGLFPFSVPACDRRFADPLGCPAYAAAGSGWMMTSTYARPYMIGGLNTWRTGAGYGGDNAGFGAAWTRFGMGQYTEDRAFFYGGVNAGEHVSIGGRLHLDRFRIACGSYSSTHTVHDGDGMISLSPFPQMTLAYRQDNIVSIFRRNRRDLLYPESSFGAHIIPARGISFNWNYLHTSYGGSNTWSVRVNLLPSFSMAAGYSRETATYALGATMLTGRSAISYSFNYHAYLGATHRIAVNFAINQERFEPFVMKRSKAEERFTVNIQTCTARDLSRIPLLTEEHAERIIRYREIIGPVTEKAFTQLGLSKSEIEEIHDHCEGIAVEDDNPANEKPERKRKPYSGKYTGARAKTYFIRFVEAGISPGAAIRLADAVSGKNGGEIIHAIDSLSGVGVEDKKKAKAVCGH